MTTLNAILRLYESVLLYELTVNDVSVSDIKAGIQRMAHIYAPFTSNFQSSETKFPDFNNPASRCAYLHKYAPLHTYIVHDTMIKILRTVPDHFRNLLVNINQFKICSLGGGPGSDVIGILTTLLFIFGPFHPSVTIIDCMKKWEETFSLIMHQLTVRPIDNNWNYSTVSQWNYIECNLLGPMTNEVNKSIAAASLITMVKFVSAAICLDTEKMVDKIFRVVKPGAMVLFIDNAAGGFTQIIERAGKRNGLWPIFGPIRHVEYEVEALKIERFGYTSCFKTKVTIILLQKVINHQQSTKNSMGTYGHIDPAVKSPDPVNFVVLDNKASSKGQMTNTFNLPLPSEVNNKLSTSEIPTQKPVDSKAVGDQNSIGINNNSKTSSVRSTTVSNSNDLFAKNSQKPVSTAVGDLSRNGVSNISKTISASSTTVSNMNDLSAKGSRGFLKPSTAIGQTTLNNPTSAQLENLFSSGTPLTDSLRSLTRHDAAFPFEHQRPIAVVSPKSPTRKSPAPNRISGNEENGPSSTVRTYQPTPGNWRQRDQPLTEVRDDSEEVSDDLSNCCSCCTIS